MITQKPRKEDVGEQSLNVAILPDRRVSRLAIGMSEEVGRRFGTYYVLNGRKLFPHITVYQAHYPSRNIPALKKAISAVVAQTRPFEISLDRFTVAYETFLFWNCINVGPLLEFHLQIVERANPLREGLILPQLRDGRKLTAEDEEEMHRYGALLIGPRYQPHLTISRLRSSADGEGAIDSLGKRDARFLPWGVVLGYLGEHGTVTGVIERFRFK